MNDEKRRLQMLPGIRWDILRTLHVGGRLGATETMCRRVIDTAWLGVTSNELRDQMFYLEERKLVKIARSEIEDWRITLTRHGTDLVEYRVDCEPGIARPPLGQ